jgi:Rps23 Pro-64 3,4-dihydroxylase Tpa1-like proline 4-hydroxylase
MINYLAMSLGVKLETHGACIFSNLIEPDYAILLCNNFPIQEQQGINPEERAERDSLKASSSYNLINHRLDKTAQGYLLMNKQLHTAWSEFINTILSDKYAASLGEKLGINLSNSKREIEFLLLKHGGHHAPHYDTQKNRILTQIFYFNTEWDATWGGMVNLLKDKSEDQVALTIPPLYIYSATVIAQQKFWHEVTTLSEKAKFPRLSVQLLFFE